MKWLNVLCVRCLNFSVWRVPSRRPAARRPPRPAAGGAAPRPRAPTYIYIWLLWDIMSHVA